MNNDYYLPQASWRDHENIFRKLIEGDESTLGDECTFLMQLGLVNDDTLGAEVTELGKAYFDARFIKTDIEESNKILREALLKFPPAEALLQLLYGVDLAKKDNALAVLKSRGFWFYSDETPLTHFLLLLNQVGLIAYSSKLKTIRILHNVRNEQCKIPENIYIDRATPYSNIEWLRRILTECSGHIYWLDKHFLKSGLKYLWEIADASKIKSITIISILLKDHDESTIDEYRRLKRQLYNCGIKLEWLIISPASIRDSHDRWILTQSAGWNLPDIGTIISGNRSEINKSPNYVQLSKEFRRYMDNAKELGT